MADPDPKPFVAELTLPRKSTKLIDLLAYVTGIGGNVAVLPQVIRAWSGPAPGLAVLTWILFIIVGIIWLLYAIIHKQKPLIAAQITGLIFNSAVIIGWLIHTSGLV